jgi:hypothetical protein
MHILLAAVLLDRLAGNRFKQARNQNLPNPHCRHGNAQSNAASAPKFNKFANIRAIHQFQVAVLLTW